MDGLFDATRWSAVMDAVQWPVIMDAVQWPAMVVTLVAAWLVASQSKRKRSWGFWCFVASNVLWIAWGWHASAWALIALQIGLFGLNVRGAWKNEPA